MKSEQVGGRNGYKIYKNTDDSGYEHYIVKNPAGGDLGVFDSLHEAKEKIINELIRKELIRNFIKNKTYETGTIPKKKYVKIKYAESLPQENDADHPHNTLYDDTPGGK